MISIITSIYNDAKNLSRCMLSVLKQTYQDFEFIIVDDASTDGSAEIMREFADSDKRIKIITNQKNLGLTKSLNVGLKKSRYDLIARVDGDDFWAKDKLEKQLDFLTRHKDYGIVGTNIITINTINNNEAKLALPEGDELIRKRLLKTTPFVHSSIMFRKNIVPEGYNEKYLTSQDYDLYMRILLKSKGYNLQDYFTHRSIYGRSSISYKKWKTQRLNRIRMRYVTFKYFKHTIFDYRYFIPDIFILFIPSKLNKFKLKVLSFFE